MSSTPFSIIDADVFRRLCARFATGVAIASVCDASAAPHGLTINSFTSVSLDPPLVLICIDNRAVILNVFREATHFAINILRSGQQDLSNRFATRTDDRFEDVRWHTGSHGVPVIEGVLATLICATTRRVEAGDHTILLAEVMAGELAAGTGLPDPLLYFNSGYAQLGFAEGEDAS